MASEDLSDQIARYCDECEQHVAARVVGRLIKCTECGYIIEDHRLKTRSVDTDSSHTEVTDE